MWGRALNWRQRFRPLKYPLCPSVQGSPSPRCAQAGCGNGRVTPWPQVHRMHKREVWSVLISACHLLKSMVIFRPHPVKPVGGCRQRSWRAFWTPLVYHPPEHMSNSTQIIVLEKRQGGECISYHPSSAVFAEEGHIPQLSFEIPHGLMNLAFGFQCSPWMWLVASLMVYSAVRHLRCLSKGKPSHGDASFSSDIWIGLITWSASHNCI